MRVHIIVVVRPVSISLQNVHKLLLHGMCLMCTGTVISSTIDCKKKEFTVLFKMAQCIAFTGEFAGNTAFALESTHFKHENLVKHGESAKHKKCRDKCVAKKSGSIIKAFNNGAR